MVLTVFYRIRVHGIHHVPRTKGMIICVNHQSNLDPVVGGCSFPRRTNFLAKASLFDILGLGWLLSQIDGIPIDREGGVRGMKETLKRLKRGESILIFPEGTRSRDGKLLPLKPGFVTLAKRTKVPLLPMGIAGTYEAWPPGSKFPSSGTVHVVIGEPIPPAQFLDLSETELIALLTDRLSNCCQEARLYRESALEDRMEQAAKS